MDAECKCCGEDYTVHDGMDPSEWCDQCAQKASREFGEILQRLVQWDKDNPKGRVYPIGPNDVEKQLDALCEEARIACSKFYGIPETMNL